MMLEKECWGRPGLIRLLAGKEERKKGKTENSLCCNKRPQP